VLTQNALPGLDRLVAVLEHSGLNPSLLPPVENQLQPGTLVLGASIDPVLAKFYDYADGGKLGDLRLFHFGENSIWNIVTQNTFIRDIRKGEPPWTNEVLYFGLEVGASCGFAVVPSLSRADGVQPVLYVDEYEEIHAYPIASSVDNLFSLWAGYCELRLKRYGVLETWKVDVQANLLTDDARVVVEDTELVRMMKEGRFDRIIGEDAEGRNWVKQVLEASAIA